MEDYGSNSHKSKERMNAAEVDKRVQKVVTGTAKRHSNKWKRLLDSYIFTDVLIPEGKKIISNIVEVLLYNEVRSNKRRDEPRISYSSCYDRSPSKSSQKKGDRFYCDDVTFESRADAERVLQELRDAIIHYGSASMMDLYRAADLSCSYTYNDYGWEDLSEARTYMLRTGEYAIRLPKATALD